MSPSTQGRDNGVRSIGRAIALLDLFDELHPYRSLRQIVELTELPKTTVVRLLATLTDLGLVSDRGDQTFALGAGFLKWLRLAQGIWDVGPDVRTIMRSLSDECGETVNIYVRQHDRRVCIAQEECSSTVRSVIPVGVPLPLTVGAPALVLLSNAPRSIVAALEEQTSISVSERLTEVMRTGWAVSHGEREFGASAVAAPLRGSGGQVIAALTVSGPTSRFTTDRIELYAKAVVTAAASIQETGLASIEANIHCDSRR